MNENKEAKCGKQCFACKIPGLNLGLEILMSGVLYTRKHICTMSETSSQIYIFTF